MAARLGIRRDVATHYAAPRGAQGGEATVQLGRAVDQPVPDNNRACWCMILCCPCTVFSFMFTHLFRNNLATAFFYLGIIGSGCGYGAVTYIVSFQIDSLICYVNLGKWVGR